MILTAKVFSLMHCVMQYRPQSGANLIDWALKIQHLSMHVLIDC